MAGHQMFHDATVKFTEDFVHSLPRKLSEYAQIIQSTFKLSFNECENDEYSCSGSIQNLARLTENFLKLVSEEEKKTISELISDENSKRSKRRRLESSVLMRCPVCEFTSKEVAGYRNHIRSHKSNEELKDKLCFKCDQCKDRTFESTNVDTYLRHVRAVHMKLKAVLCELCGLSFKRADALGIHKLSVHGPGAEKRHQCETCDKKFLRKAHLLDHYQVHSKVKEFSCELCTNRFKSESAKQKHVLYKHTNPKSFKCDKCKKRCNTKDNLRSHMKSHEKQKTGDSESEVQAINKKIADHIRAEFESNNIVSSSTEAAADDASVNVSVDQSQSLSTSAVPSPAIKEPHTEADATSAPQSIGQIEYQEQTEEVVAPLPQPVYPSRPASVNSQYTPFSDAPAHNNDKDLDEIFPESAPEEPEEAFDNQYVSKIPQEELDSVFRQDVIRPDPHSQLSRPGSVGSHHTESLPATDPLNPILPVHFRPNVSNDSAVPSPQSVCSSQFTHQSRPPSVASQQSSYHDPNSMVPSYLQSQAYVMSQPPPNIVFTQPISNMQPISNAYDKPISCDLTSGQQAMHYLEVNNAGVDEHLINAVSTFNGHMGHPSCLTHHYSAPVHYTSTPQECITSQSTARCVTPHNFPTTPTFRQQTADGRPIDVFTNLTVPSDTLLLPELHTPNKNFPDNESVVADFSNTLFNLSQVSGENV